MKRLDAFLAIYVGKEGRDEVYSRMWDMLRYDRCYPVEVPGQYHDEFIIVKQAYQKDRITHFHFPVWEACGFRTLAMVTSLEGPTVPFELYVEMDAIVDLVALSAGDH